MPWDVREKNGEFCVYKKGTDVIVDGGCHANRADAVKHMRALYANDPTMKYSVLAFTEGLLQDTEDPNVKWIRAWRYSSWDHPKYGKVEITPEIGQQFQTYFNEGTLGRKHLVNYDHGSDAAKGGKAGGEVIDVEPREDGIYYKLRFTDTANQEIQNGEWHYVSPEYDDWVNPETGEVHENMMFDIALTNTPFFKGQTPLNFSEVFEPREFSTLSAEQRNNLKDSQFLYIEPDGTRHLPVPDAAHIRAAITRLSQSNTGTVGGESWLTDSLRKSLLAKARKMLESKGGSPKGGKAVDELLKQFASRLGVDLADDASEEDILAAADDLNSAIEPLRKAKVEGEKQRTFREAFPDEFKAMERLKKGQVEADARTFAENYRRFTVRNGDQEFKSTLGFSELVIDEITDTYKKFSDKTLSTKDLAKLLDLIGDKGIVDYSESGSSRGVTDRTFSEDPKQAFAEAVLHIQAEDNLEYEQAINVARMKFPEIYEEYQRAIPRI